MSYPSVVTKEKRRWAYGFVVIAVGYLAAFYVIPSFLASSDGDAGSGRCIPDHAVRLDDGEHHGQPWRISGSIEKVERNEDCAHWLLKVGFSPEGISPGSWIEGWSIPAGGHLPSTATIDALEEEGGGALGGVVGSRVRSVVLKLRGGRTMVLHPKDPRKGLQRRFVWLHNLRYFLVFFSAGDHVKTAKLLDANGKVIFTAHNQEGELVGNMVY